MVTGMLRLNLLWNSLIPTISVFLVSLCRNTSAISSSFQAQSRLTTPSVISGGPERGRTTRRNTVHDDAPSTIAASTRLSGIWLKKLASR